MQNVSLFETNNYSVVVTTYPSGEFEGQGCYGVFNRVTGVLEIFVNLLPKAIYLAREAQEWLDEVLSDSKPKPNQLMLLH